MDVFEFHKEQFVIAPGQFAVRGGLIDIWSFSNDKKNDLSRGSENRRNFGQKVLKAFKMMKKQLQNDLSRSNSRFFV